MCLIAHDAYGAMRGGSAGHIGGVERQTTMLARWLAGRGYKVSILTWHEGQEDSEEIDGVSVIKMCRRDAGLPIVRFFSPRATSLFAAMKKADADVYYHNCGEYYTGLAALWCRLHGRRFVYSVAHDNHCDANLPTLRKPYEKILYKYGLRTAERRIVQTEAQRRMLEVNFRLGSTVLPMPCAAPSADHRVLDEPPAVPRVLWVGRAAKEKRMEWILEVSAKMPSVGFDVAAANVQTPYADDLHRRAREIPNLRWLGPVSRDEMPALYERATCLCSTSAKEGFPNTFLEAWSYGRPVVTFFDPDNLIKNRRLGFVCRTIDDFVEAISNLAGSSALWCEMSRNARANYEEVHAPKKAMPRFEEQLVLAGSGQPV